MVIFVPSGNLKKINSMNALSSIRSKLLTPTKQFTSKKDFYLNYYLPDVNHLLLSSQLFPQLELQDQWIQHEISKENRKTARNKKVRISVVTGPSPKQEKTKQGKKR